METGWTMDQELETDGLIDWVVDETGTVDVLERM